MSDRDLPARRRRLLISILAVVVALALCGAVVTGCSLFGGKETTTSTTVATTAAHAEETTTTGLPGGLSTGSTTTAGTPAGDTTTTTAGAGSGDTTTTTAGAGGGTTTTEKLSTAEQRLADGHIKAMGFIKKVWEQDGKRYISIDYAEMLTGQAAVDAAVADGVIPAGGSLDNDYYIRNASTDKRDFEVTPLVAIHTSSWGGEMDHAVTWGEFISFWSASPPDEQAALLRDSPWWIERDGPTIIKIDEQYLP